MRETTNKRLWLGMALLAGFVCFSWSLTWVDLRPIGPLGTEVAYGGLNRAVHDFFGVHWWLYHVTDWLGQAVLALPVGFGLLGLGQWIRRKSIFRVDRRLRILGIFYLAVFVAFGFFEICVINWRPVLVQGALEASYPSSTTMLAMCVLPTAMMEFRRRIGHPELRRAAVGFCGALLVFLVLGRLVSGVHWLTDILGGAMLSAALVLLYGAAIGEGEA